MRAPSTTRPTPPRPAPCRAVPWIYRRYGGYRRDPVRDLHRKVCYQQDTGNIIPRKTTRYLHWSPKAEAWVLGGIPNFQTFDELNIFYVSRKTPLPPGSVTTAITNSQGPWCVFLVEGIAPILEGIA